MGTEKGSANELEDSPQQLRNARTATAAYQTPWPESTVSRKVQAAL
jgi:hypothetical protein